MFKTIIAASAVFVTVAIPLHSNAQEPEEAKPVITGHAAASSGAAAKPPAAPAGDQAADKLPGHAAAVPLANLFPTRISADARTTNPIVAPPATSLRQESPGMQHEFHGGLTTIFSVTNSVSP